MRNWFVGQAEPRWKTSVFLVGLFGASVPIVLATDGLTKFVSLLCAAAILLLSVSLIIASAVGWRWRATRKSPFRVTVYGAPPGGMRLIPAGTDMFTPDLVIGRIGLSVKAGTAENVRVRMVTIEFPNDGSMFEHVDFVPKVIATFKRLGQQEELLEVARFDQRTRPRLVMFQSDGAYCSVPIGGWLRASLDITSDDWRTQRVQIGVAVSGRAFPPPPINVQIWDDAFIDTQDD